MRDITIQPKKLIAFCLCYLALILLSALGLYLFFARLSAESLPLMLYVHYSVLFLTYLFSWIIIPFLTIRCVYFFVKMVRHGRREGVSAFSVKFFFNPINLLIFPSLLTENGRTYRRRCLVAGILFCLMLVVMWASTRLGSQLADQVNAPAVQSQQQLSD